MDAPAPLHVRAPATSANLGPAFDAAGIALDWWDELEVRPAPADAIHLSGEQAELLPTGRDNLVASAMGRLAAAATAAPGGRGGPPRGGVEDGRRRGRPVPVPPDLVAVALVAPEPMATSE